MVYQEDDERERNRIYTQVEHDAQAIMANIPSTRPDWAVERLAERAARAERFIHIEGQDDAYQAFNHRMDAEETSLLREVPQVIRVAPEEIDYVVHRILNGNDPDAGSRTAVAGSSS